MRRYSRPNRKPPTRGNGLAGDGNNFVLTKNLTGYVGNGYCQVLCVRFLNVNKNKKLIADVKNKNVSRPSATMIKVRGRVVLVPPPALRLVGAAVELCPKFMITSLRIFAPRENNGFSSPGPSLPESSFIVRASLPPCGKCGQ